MKKIIFTAMVAMFVSVGANAQFKLGVKGSYGFENFDISTNPSSQLTKNNSTSWDLGILAQISLGGTFYLQPEVLYLSQKIESLSTELIPLEENSKRTHIQIPVNLLFKINLAVVNVFASGGAYFGYSINGTKFDSLQKTDWGVSIGAGVELWKFQVGARYNWALKNISDVSNITLKNNRFNVSVAIFIL
jgi:hypothetical protein